MVSTFHFSSDDNHADFAFHVDLDQDMRADVQEGGGDPKMLREAPSYPDRPRWKEAMDREVETLEKAGTWITVSRLPNKNVVGRKWVFRIKRNADGSVDKYKDRLAAKSFMQVHGVHHFGTSPPVMKLSNFHTTLAGAARYDSKVEKSTATDVRQCFAVYPIFFS